MLAGDRQDRKKNADFFDTQSGINLRDINRRITGYSGILFPLVSGRNSSFQGGIIMKLDVALQHMARIYAEHALFSVRVLSVFMIS
jgi:hypothetical protein